MLERFYRFLIVACPWVLLAGVLQFHFQSFLPYQGVFKGQYAFDFFTVIDIYATAVLLLHLYRKFFGKIKPVRGKLPKEFAVCILILLVAGFLQVAWREIYPPVLSTPFEYFRSLFIYPLVLVVIFYQTFDEKLFQRFLRNFVLMTGVFCLFALLQYFSGIFPGESKDFMGRLVWPYIDFVTLKASSANWVAFFVTPGFLISFILGFEKLLSKKFDRTFVIYSLVSALAGLALYLVQSYGAYAAIFVSISLFLFRRLGFKQFAGIFLILILIGVGMFLVQKNSFKYKVLSHQVDNYKYEDSLSTREQILKVNVAMIKEQPFWGVGLNLYQQYFEKNQERILGKQINEGHIPPHPHNFFIGFYANLGLLGFVAILTLILIIFVQGRFNPKNPAIFVLVAMMVHGLIDSYYWKQEIAYNFWLIILMYYLFAEKSTKLKTN